MLLALVMAVAIDANSGADIWVSGPHAVSILWDGYTTQRSDGLNGACLPQGCFSAYERNPLPGMKTTAGRALWAGAEVAGVYHLSKRSRKWGRIVGWTLTAIHVGFGISNWRSVSQAKNHAFR